MAYTVCKIPIDIQLRIQGALEIGAFPFLDPKSFISVYFLFLKKKVVTCPLMGQLILLFWTSGDVSSEFQNQSGQPYSNLTYVM